jgi:Uma2 family endonuclease
MKEHAHFVRDEYWTGADLLMEVVSGSADDHDRDYVKKRLEYARGGVSEYWIIDPDTKTVLVLVLREGRYVEHGAFTPGERASSPTFEGIVVDVKDVFEAT